MNVPDKTFAIFPEIGFSYEQIRKIIIKPEKKRKWFTPHFYNCLPLVIGNQYGFLVTSEWGFTAEWNGSSGRDAVTIIPDNPEIISTLLPRISSHFGEGIITIEAPFAIRTPPGVNIMTVNPPNHVVENITVMTGVVETDNLRRKFTFNLKIQVANRKVHYPAGTPLAAFIPIPRYFSDSFTLELASNLFPNEYVEEELAASYDAYEHRISVEPNLENHLGRHYFKGVDIYNNPFPDHQKG
jgi:hypothetical protein